MPVVSEAVTVLDLSFDAPDGQVRLVRFLPVDGQVVSGSSPVSVASGVGLNEPDGLDEHAGGTAAGVVDPSLVWLDHRHEQLHDRTGGVELAPLPAFGHGELFQEVLVDPSENVSCLGICSPDLDVADQVTSPSRCLSRASRP